MDSTAYRCFDLCGDKGWTVCLQLTLGELALEWITEKSQTVGSEW